MYRPIGINRNNFRGHHPAAALCARTNCMGVEWIAVGSNAFNEAVPFYAQRERHPRLSGEHRPAMRTTDSFYWANRHGGAAMADAHYPACASAHVERYQLALATAGHRHAQARLTMAVSGRSRQKDADRLPDRLQPAAGRQGPGADRPTFCTKVLFSASMEMKNGFARSDS